MDGRKVGLFLLVEEQFTNLKYIITFGTEKQRHQNWIKDIIKRCIYDHTCTVAALLSLDLETCPWHLKFSSVFLCTFPAGFISCCACVPHMKCTSFSLPAGFAWSRLLLHWKTRILLYWVVWIHFVWPFDDRGKIPENLSAQSLHQASRSLFSVRHGKRNFPQDSHQVL